jgi:hypothetical protein
MKAPGIPYRDDWASLYREARAGRPIAHLEAKGFPRDVIVAVLQVLANRDGSVSLHVARFEVERDGPPQ